MGFGELSSILVIKSIEADLTPLLLLILSSKWYSPLEKREWNSEAGAKRRALRSEEVRAIAARRKSGSTMRALGEKRAGFDKITNERDDDTES
jgi:hypothetical protein